MRTLRYIEVLEGKRNIRCCIDPVRKTYELHERTYECGDDGDAESGPCFWESASPWQEIDCGPWDGSEPTEEGIWNRVDEVDRHNSEVYSEFHMGRFAIRDNDGTLFSGFDDRQATWDMRDRVRLYTNIYDAHNACDKIAARHKDIDWRDRLEIIDLDTAVRVKGVK